MEKILLELSKSKPTKNIYLLYFGVLGILFRKNMIKPEDSNPILYGVGVLAMMLSLSLFVFALYIAPHILFEINYDVPEFIIIILYWYNVVQGLSGIRLFVTMLLPYLLAAAILGLMAKRLTTRVEGKTDLVDLSNNSLGELAKPAFYEIVLILAVLISLFFAIYPILMKFE